MLRPTSGAAQWVVSQTYEISPWIPATEYLDSYGNLCQRFVLAKGDSVIDVETHIVVADDVTPVNEGEGGFVPVDQLPADCLAYLLPSRYCPSDRTEERAMDIALGHQVGFNQVSAICYWIRDNIEYEYGVSTQSTDALDTIEAGAGVCRDFAHIGITMCRSLRIPARYVAGYLHKLEPMDMHAWFEAFVGGRWHTFDATQEAREAGRVVVSYGRDATDVAFLSNYGPMEVTTMKVSVERTEETS